MTPGDESAELRPQVQCYCREDPYGHLWNPPVCATNFEAQRRLAVVCSEGCGFTSRRLYPADPKPCPNCGAPVDVGIPRKGARMRANGSLGGHIELIWTRWE